MFSIYRRLETLDSDAQFGWRDRANKDKTNLRKITPGAGWESGVCHAGMNLRRRRRTATKAWGKMELSMLGKGRQLLTCNIKWYRLSLQPHVAEPRTLHAERLLLPVSRKAGHTSGKKEKNIQEFQKITHKRGCLIFLKPDGRGEKGPPMWIENCAAPCEWKCFRDHKWGRGWRQTPHPGHLTKAPGEAAARGSAELAPSRGQGRRPRLQGPSRRSLTRPSPLLLLQGSFYRTLSLSLHSATVVNPWRHLFATLFTSRVQLERRRTVQASQNRIGMFSQPPFF